MMAKASSTSALIGVSFGEGLFFAAGQDPLSDQLLSSFQ
jgi:hypothetical protein